MTSHPIDDVGMEHPNKISCPQCGGELEITGANSTNTLMFVDCRGKCKFCFYIPLRIAAESEVSDETLLDLIGQIKTHAQNIIKRNKLLIQNRPVVRQSVIIYVDDRTEDGREALKLLDNVKQRIVTIPINGGIPFAVWGRRKYAGLEEIKLLAVDIRNENQTQEDKAKLSENEVCVPHTPVKIWDEGGHQ